MAAIEGALGEMQTQIRKASFTVLDLAELEDGNEVEWARLMHRLSKTQLELSRVAGRWFGTGIATCPDRDFRMGPFRRVHEHVRSWNEVSDYFYD